MTKQEAIEALKMNNALMCFDAITGDDIPYEFLNSTNKAVYDANLIAIEALEKQIPKKPHPYIAFDGIKRNGCPNCFEERGKNEILYAGQKHCSVCGQRIDWEREAEQ